MRSRYLSVAWQLFWQEKHDRHQRFLRFTQSTLMIFIIALSQTGQGIQDYLQGNLENLLGADAVISQQQSMPKTQLHTLEGMTQKIVLTKQVSTTLTHNGLWQRAKLKAVGDDYPLQGELRVASSLSEMGKATTKGPAVGEIWLDSRLLVGLSAKVGQRIVFANQALLISGVLLHEPDRLTEEHSVAMRAMIHLQDLDKLIPSSDVEHRYLLAANTQQVADILQWQINHLPAASVYHQQGKHPLALFWKRTENFIGLASVILFFMAAIAIEQLTHVHLRKEHYFSAVCLSVGVSKKESLIISVWKWCLHLLYQLPSGILIGALCHWLIIYWLTDTFSELTWHFDILLALKAIACISVIFLIFQAPVWLSLKHSSVAHLLSYQQAQMSHWLTGASALTVLFGVAAAYSDNLLLTSMLLLAMAVCILLLLGLSWLALTLGETLTHNISGLAPFTLFMMKQRLLSKSTQILGMGLCAFLLLFTLMLLRDLGNSMVSYQRQHDGNLLVTQASQLQMTGVQAWAKQHNIALRQSKAYLYARLTNINGQHLTDFSQNPSDSLATFTRPIRLHWRDDVPANNRVVSGQWWPHHSDNWQQVSVEQEVMTDLGLTLGDSLTFFIGEQSVEFEITASHAYKPGAGSITFWVMMPRAARQHLNTAHYYMSSLELTEPQFSVLGELWQQYPSLRMVSLKEMTLRFDKILAMVTQVIAGFAILIILLAGIVIISSVHSLEIREKKKNSIIMSFGFDNTTCLKLNVIEWLVTGSIAACGAIAGTWIAGILMYQSQFSMSYTPDAGWLSMTLLVILLVVTLTGVYASKHSLSGSIRMLLAE